jgi:preprotein translocase subunit SecG
MLSNFYSTHYGIPQGTGVYQPPSSSTFMNTSFTLLVIFLIFIISIGLSFCRNSRHALQQDEIQDAEISHQREVLERIWKMKASRH